MNNMKESDWKKFRKVRVGALEDYCNRIFDEWDAIRGQEMLSAHERYLKLYALIRERDKKLGRIFDGFSRSSAPFALKKMANENLVTDEQLAEFSQDVRDYVNEAY